MYQTEQQAHRVANIQSQRYGRCYFVVYEPDPRGDYHVADDYELATFHFGLSDDHILASYVDGQRDD